MKKIPLIQETLAPNLIPMIDIMFLLLLFFMLGADMGQRALEEVQLPWANSAEEEHPSTAPDTRLTINAHHDSHGACAAYEQRLVCRNDSHWKIAIRGRDCTQPEQLALALQTETAATRHLDPQGRSVSDRQIMIRADAAAPYALAQRAMNLCAEQGIYRVQVGVARPPGR